MLDQEFDELPEIHRVRKLYSDQMSYVNRKQFLLTVSKWFGYFVFE